MSSLIHPVFVPVPVSTPTIAPGILFFVVGPSGVGKSSLLAWVRSRLPVGGDTLFARRTITRGAAPGEGHEPIDRVQFEAEAATGGFSLAWEANDFCYGVRAGMEADLQAGHRVVVDGSRGYVPTLLQRFPEARVIWVTASNDAIRNRLETRQREAGAALLQRLDRAQQFSPPAGPATLRINNCGPIEVAGAALLALITRDHRPTSD